MGEKIPRLLWSLILNLFETNRAFLYHFCFSPGILFLSMGKILLFFCVTPFDSYRCSYGVTFVDIYKKHNDFFFLLCNKFGIWAKSDYECTTISKTRFSNSHLGNLNIFTRVQIVCLKPSILFFSWLKIDMCFTASVQHNPLYVFFQTHGEIFFSKGGSKSLWKEK